MKKRIYTSKKSKKKKRRIFLLVVTLILIIALIGAIVIFRDYLKLSSVTSFVVNPVTKQLNIVSEKISDTFKSFGDNKKLLEENKDLKLENSKLKAEKINSLVLQKQIENYEKLLNIQGELNSFDIVTCKKLFESTSSYYTGVTVDKGMNSNIVANSPVIYEEYLVGVVDSVDIISSRIRTIYEKNFSLIAKNTRNNELFRIRGNSTSSFSEYLICDYLPERSDVKIGDVIETTTLGEIYPSSIKIGTVSNIEYAQDQYPIKAYIKPFIDVRKLEYLYVLIDSENEGEEN